LARQGYSVHGALGEGPLDIRHFSDKIEQMVLLLTHRSPSTVASFNNEEDDEIAGQRSHSPRGGLQSRTMARAGTVLFEDANLMKRAAVTSPSIGIFLWIALEAEPRAESPRGVRLVERGGGFPSRRERPHAPPRGGFRHKDLGHRYRRALAYSYNTPIRNIAPERPTSARAPAF